MPDKEHNEIIELTDVVEEGHPDQPNLPSQGEVPATDEALDDLDLEKEIDEIFSGLGASSSEDKADGSSASLSDDMDLDELLGVSSKTVDTGQAPSGDLPELELPDDPALSPEPGDKNLEQDQGGPADAPEEITSHDAPSPQESMPAPEPEEPVRSSLDPDLLGPLSQRLAAMEEKVAQLESAEALTPEQLDSRLTAFAEELAAKQQEQADALLLELRSELEQHFEQKLQTVLDEATARNQEESAQVLAKQMEEVSALIDSKLQEAQDREGDVTQAVAAQMEGLRADLLKELEDAIPAAAAQVIREEILALTQEH